MGDSRNTATRRRQARQEELREQLRAKGLEQHVLECARKLHDEYKTLEASQIQSLKASADLRLKMMNKYLPDLKAVEHSVDQGDSVLSLILKEISGNSTGLPAPVDDEK